MPESMSVERRQVMKAYGAEIILTSKEEGMAGAVKEAKRLVVEKDMLCQANLTITIMLCHILKVQPMKS